MPITFGNGIRPVDGEATSETMAPGYNDANAPNDNGGQIIDGSDGLADGIIGNGGADTIDAGLGDDTVYGDDVIVAGSTTTEVSVGSEGGNTLLVWGASQLSFTGGNPFPDSVSGLSDSRVDDITMTINATATPVAVGVSDRFDSTFNDGDLSQDLINNEFIDGESGRAGDRITPEYAYSVRNVDTGELINVYAVEFNSNDVVGFVSDAPMELGATYQFLDNTSSYPSVPYSSLATTYRVPGTDEGNGDAPGAAGDDLIDGNAGNDLLFGQGGSDTLTGGTGEDTIWGDDGPNVATGSGTPTRFDIDALSGGRLVSEDGSVAAIVSSDGFVQQGAGFLGATDGVLYAERATDANPDRVSFDFETPVEDLSFTVFDLNEGRNATFGAWDDEVTIIALDEDGTQLPVTFSGGRSLDIDGNTAERDTLSNVAFLNDSNPDNLQVSITGEVAFLEVVVTAGPGNANAGYVGLGNLTGTPVDTTPTFEELLSDQDGAGGADVLNGDDGADQTWGEGGDDTIIVDSAGEGAGDIVVGGNGPDGFTDEDVLDLTAAGDVTISAVADETDPGAERGTVTFEDGSTLAFYQIETILTDTGPDPDGVVDGEDFGEVMGQGYDDGNAPNDGGGDVIGPDADSIDGNGGDDVIFSGDGDDTVNGGDGDDNIDDAPGADDGTGRDLFNGNAGNDTLFGGDDDDTLIGGDDDDQLFGEDDDDLLDGGAGDDSLVGDLLGDNGDDTLDGGLGADTMQGGDGNDIFLVPTAAEGAGDDIEGGAGPDDAADFDVLDLRGAGPVAIAAEDDPNDTDAERGTVTFGDGGVLTFEGIEQILSDAPVNAAPEATDDVLSVAQDGSATVNVLANDTDADGDDLDILGTPTADNGAISFDAETGDITYTPDAGFTGSDTIRYTVTDPSGATDTGEVTVTVTEPDNTAPVAVDDTASATPDAATVIDVLGNDSDPDGDPLTVTSASAANGTVAIAGDGSLVYIPASGFEGDDTISYTISDGALSDTAEVIVSVGEDNSAPEAADDTGTTDVGTPAIFDVLANDSDPDGDPLSIAEASAANGIVATLPNGQLIYIPDGGFEGEDTISYTVTDGTDTDTAELRVTVGSDNTAPAAVDDVAATEVDTLTLVDVLGNDSDADGDPLTVTAASADNGLVAVIPGGPLVYIPNAGFEGEDTITYTVSDGQGGTDEGAVAMTVGGGNQAPEIVDDVATTTEGAPVTIDVLANDSDPDGDPLTVTGASAPNGTVAIGADGTLVYIPDAGFVGEDTISYTAEDPDGAAGTGSVTVTVDSGNQAPDAVDDVAATTPGQSVLIDVLDNDSDPDGDPLTVTGASAANGTVAITGAGQVLYIPNAGFEGTDTISYTVSDGTLTDTAEVSVDVETDLTDPVVVDDTASTDEDMPTLIDVLANDSDPNGDPLTVTEASAANGTVAINADGTLSYTPDADFFGEDTISYIASDPDGNTGSGQALVDVAPVQDAPEAVDDTGTTLEDSPVNLDVLANDSDADDDPLTITEASAVNGSVTINGDGTLAYTPDTGFVGDDTVSYTVSDGIDSDSAEAIVTVEADTGGDGVVDGTDGDDDIGPGFVDADGDEVDGPDGVDDTIAAGDGDDTVNGGAGDDTFLDGPGSDGYIGGPGDDTYTGQDTGHVVVYTDDNGNGSVTHYPSLEVDDVASVETFVGGELPGEDDKISFTDGVLESETGSELQGISDNAFGLFFPEDGAFVNFGPDAEFTLSEVLAGAVGGSAVGEYFIQGGDEDGQVGDIAYENFEQVFFNVDEDPNWDRMLSDADALAADEAEEEEMA